MGGNKNTGRRTKQASITPTAARIAKIEAEGWLDELGVGPDNSLNRQMEATVEAIVRGLPLRPELKQHERVVVWTSVAAVMAAIRRCRSEPPGTVRKRLQAQHRRIPSDLPTDARLFHAEITPDLLKYLSRPAVRSPPAEARLFGDVLARVYVGITGNVPTHHDDGQGQGNRRGPWWRFVDAVVTAASIPKLSVRSVADAPLRHRWNKNPSRSRQ